MKLVTIAEIQRVIDQTARWLAMDGDGRVYWFVTKPLLKTNARCWDDGLSGGNLGKIKVAEFEGKSWTDCCVELKQED